MTAELTFLQVLSGIGSALRKAYPDAAIFHETTLQSITAGSFNVIALEASQVEQLGSRRKNSVTFDVVYYPLPQCPIEDCLRVATDLPLLLETITTPSGAKLHPISIDTNIVDDVLHSTARFDYGVIARRVMVDDSGHETDYTQHGDLDNTEIMQKLEMQKGQCL